MEVLTGAGLRPSMSRKGNPCGNAAAGSFLKTLKCEEAYRGDYESYEDVVERLLYFIDAVCIKKRPHSSIGSMSPEAFDRQMEIKLGAKNIHLLPVGAPA